ncbi:MAG: hypothetical protein II180_11935 [Proteobacteria bacterium]|nr:hypothetical protein [Pseudomonadota bacterium]
MTKRTRRHTQDKDSAINAFMSKPEIFADLFNAYLYEGEQVIQPEALVPADRLLSEVIGNARGQAKLTRYRDVFMAYRDKNASYILLGIENQSAIHYAMPLRNMIYDALSLLARVRQKSARHLALKDLKRPDEFLSRFAKTDHIDPVFTLTVYYGHVPWDGPFSLHDMIRFPDEKLKRFVPDYFINLVVPAKLGDEMLARLNTELSEVFWCIRLAGNKEAFDAYIINHSKFKEMSYEAVQMINACTHANIPVKQDGEKVNMCQAIIDLKKEAYDNGFQKGEESGFQKGEESGFQKGEESGILQSSSRIAINMYRSKYDMQEIVRMTGLNSEAIEKLVMAQPEERK